ncbi:hypothetical protein ACFOY4_08035 [Actinomadura syzygii]|uniref:Uncharacterized protein n=1 Tax=Actinomadura syzygii TaxID=1427538 RepID=A0A5D0UGI7_9ACTN|nr:hypothetical protein [Actinomadura syzygii]TYC16735.1 hypothetical protein FXF65_09255 [Actinomadura syzygii]
MARRTMATAALLGALVAAPVVAATPAIAAEQAPAAGARTQPAALPDTATAAYDGATVRGIPPYWKGLCAKKIVRKIVPACWKKGHAFTPKQVRIMRCIAAHGPYAGPVGAGKLGYWAVKCGRTDWKKW